MDVPQLQSELQAMETYVRTIPTNQGYGKLLVKIMTDVEALGNSDESNGTKVNDIFNYLSLIRELLGIKVDLNPNDETKVIYSLGTIPE